MKHLKFAIICLIASMCCITANAKKYKWQYESAVEVYTTGQGQNRTQLVKAWAVREVPTKP